MELKTLQQHFLDECIQFSDLCESILDHAVPSCPGWTVQDLIEHLGTVHRRAIARIGSDQNPTGYDLDIPSESMDLMAWFTAGWNELNHKFETLGPEYKAWNWTGSNQNVGWMIRRQAHEAAIHRYDAELAHMGLPSVSAFKSLPQESIPFGYSPEFAIDGIEERLTVSIGGKANLKSSLPGSLHLHATDIEAEWSLTLLHGKLELNHAHTKADAALRGTASEIYLWTWGRLPAEVLECFGNDDVIEAWKKLPA